MSSTIVSIAGEDFWLNGRPTYRGREWRGRRIEGLLFNARLIQGIFDDANPATRGRWDYPDGPWDPERNTAAFLAAMPAWREHGLLAMVVGLQGGSPYGYSQAQPWENSAFDPDGALRPAYGHRLRRILRRADELGMVVILSLFYFGQDERLRDEAAVLRATDEITDWLLREEARHVLVEIANEVDVPRYEHPILRPPRVPELIRRVQERSRSGLDSPAGRLLVGTSFGGGAIPTPEVVAVSDLVLLHGNRVERPDGLRAMVRTVRGLPAYRGQPIVFDEDDHFGFDQPDHHLLAALESHASWGYFDYRLPGEGFPDGFQSMPCDWEIRSPRKRAFFGLLREITAAGPRPSPAADPRAVAPSEGPAETGAPHLPAARAASQTPPQRVGLAEEVGPAQA